MNMSSATGNRKFNFNFLKQTAEKFLINILIVAAVIFLPAVPSFGEQPPLKHNPWELIIYRPENTKGMNDIRCWLKLEDAETGEDVTYSKISAKYEWVSIGKNIHKDPMNFYNLFVPSRWTVLYPYQRTYYLSGGMAMHLLIQKGKYKISFYTPPEHQLDFPCDNKEQWNSNSFYYDTENPAKVIFVFPEANENGFYSGKWCVDYKAPEWFIFTKPKM